MEEIEKGQEKKHLKPNQCPYHSCTSNGNTRHLLLTHYHSKHMVAEGEDCSNKVKTGETFHCCVVDCDTGLQCLTPSAVKKHLIKSHFLESLRERYQVIIASNQDPLELNECQVKSMESLKIINVLHKRTWPWRVKSDWCPCSDLITMKMPAKKSVFMVDEPDVEANSLDILKTTQSKCH